MGLFSGLKKALGGILAGAKKVFSPVLKAVGKIMSNKYVRGALLVATLVCPVLGAATSAFSATTAAGGGFMSALGNAGMAAAKMVGSLVVKTVTTPLKMLANGGASVAGAFNANGLASTLQNAASTIGNTSTSIFGNIPTDSIGQIMGKMGIGSAAADVAAPGVVAPGIPATVDTAAGVTEGVADASSKAAQTAGGFDLSESGERLFGGAKDLPISTPNLNATINATNGGGGLLDKTMNFINKNAGVTSLIGTMAASALAPDEAEVARAQWKAKADAENELNQKNAAAWGAFDPSIAGTQSGGQQVQSSQVPEFRSRAQTARDFINAGYQSPTAAVLPTASLLNRALPQPQY